MRRQVHGTVQGHQGLAPEVTYHGVLLLPAGVVSPFTGHFGEAGPNLRLLRSHMVERFQHRLVRGCLVRRGVGRDGSPGQRAGGHFALNHKAFQGHTRVDPGRLRLGDDRGSTAVPLARVSCLFYICLPTIPAPCLTSLPLGIPMRRLKSLATLRL